MNEEKVGTLAYACGNEYVSYLNETAAAEIYSLTWLASIIVFLIDEYICIYISAWMGYDMI